MAGMAPKMKTALLLAAGKATRLGELRNQWAKACVPIGESSPLKFALAKLRATGFEKVVINLHHLAEQVRAEAETFAAELDLQFLHEDPLLGTGGTLLATHDSWGLPDLVLNAKQFHDLDLGNLPPAPAVVLHPSSSLLQFGGFRFQKNQVVELLPKNQAQQASQADAGVFTGICRPTSNWVEHIRRAPVRPDGTRCLVRDGLLPALEAGEPCHPHIHEGRWMEISTPERVREAKQINAAAW